MRIVRKLSRKRFQGALLYEYERFFIPVPAKARDLVSPWLGRDVKIHIQPLSYGFAVLVYPADRLPSVYRIINRFKYLVRQLEKN